MLKMCAVLTETPQIKSNLKPTVCHQSAIHIWLHFCRHVAGEEQQQSRGRNENRMFGAEGKELITGNELSVVV